MQKFLALGLLSLSACAIHPQTEDFSRHMLPDIVHHIRCEAKRAILEILPDPKDYLRASAVTFDFLFVLTENNDATTDGVVGIPVPLGTIGIGWDARLQKGRETTQTLVVTDSFDRLLGLRCGQDAELRNFKYPITGDVGLIKTFRNFALLVDQATGLLTEVTDQVKFTTTIHKELIPTLKLTPAPDRSVLANVNLSAQRIDVHRVKLAFFPAKTAEAKLSEARAKAKTRREYLENLAAEKRLPTSVVLVDPDGKAIARRETGEQDAPGARVTGREVDVDEQRRVTDKLIQGEVRRSVRRRPDAPSDMEERAYRQYLENESRRLNERLVDELRRR